MSLHLEKIVIHHLVKNEQDELNVLLSSGPLENSVVTEDFVIHLHNFFSKKKKGYAQFSSDSVLESKMHNSDLDFFSFSSQAAEQLKDELCKYPFSDEGVLVFAEYQSLATDYIMIALVPYGNGATVKENLGLAPTDYLNIENIKLAALINLSEYEGSEDAKDYISFVKGKSGRKVSDFFLDFLGAELGMDSKVQTIVLTQAVMDFCSESGLEKEEALSLKKQVVDHCKDKSNVGDNVIISELSSELPPNKDGLSFLDFTYEQGYELEDNFPVEQSVIKKLTKFNGSGGGLNISFDAIIFEERVFYDPETDTLTIKGTPPNLRDQLVRFIK